MELHFSPLLTVAENIIGFVARGHNSSAIFF